MTKTVLSDMEDALPEIVVLGWSPMVTDPCDLHLKDGVWHDDGPLLPVELSHITNRRTLALALTRGADPVRTLWAYMGTGGMGEAVWSLSQREGSKPENVGFLDLETGEYWCRTVDEHIGTIRNWVADRNGNGEDIGVVIWSDLKPNFEKKARKELNADNVISYLGSLRPAAKDRAREYLEKTPEQARTKIGATIQTVWDSIWQ
jgi:hypothetical protein